jgi:hypothetical protein
MALVRVTNNTNGRVYVPEPISRSVPKGRAILVPEVDEAKLARDFKGKITALINAGTISVYVFPNTPTVDDAIEKRVLSSDNAMFTPEGGFAIRLVNDTGAASIKGTLVDASAVVDSAARVCEASDNDVIGSVYENGVAVGELMWVVTGGIADVLLKDGTAAVRQNWAMTSDVAGRADITNADPPAGGLINELNQHFNEIGHCLESKLAGTNVLARILMHFN